VTVTIRPARPADCGDLVPLFEQLGYPTPSAEIRGRLEACGEGLAVFVAVEDLRTLGFVAVGIQDDFVVAVHATILGLIVAEEARGKGIGAELLNAAQTWAFARGVATVTVRSNVIRERAHRFYERAGYRRFKSQYIFEKHEA
jgi:ribosomal protein S18 acetylase RimI-like enzyme